MVEGQPSFPSADDGYHGDVRRVGHDINAYWLSILSLVDLGSGLWSYARPGFFNDLEMMELGNGDFVAEDGPEGLAMARAHMTMWAAMKSPLVLSTDLGEMGSETRQVATNNLAIKVNQDWLGAKVKRIRSEVAREGVGKARERKGKRRDARDIVAAAALCDKERPTQRWRWASASDHDTDSDNLPPQNGTLYSIDAQGHAYCLHNPYSGIWSVVPYSGHGACLYSDPAGGGGGGGKKYQIGRTKRGEEEEGKKKRGIFFWGKAKQQMDWGGEREKGWFLNTSPAPRKQGENCLACLL